MELDHLRTIVVEHERENRVYESLRADIALLKDQLVRQGEKYASLENVRLNLENERQR